MRPGSLSDSLSDAFNIGEMQVHAVLVAPALPIRLAAAGVRWASERIGPAT